MTTVTSIEQTGRTGRNGEEYEVGIHFVGLNLDAIVFVSKGTSGYLARWSGLGTQRTSKFSESPEAAIREMFGRL